MTAAIPYLLALAILVVAVIFVLMREQSHARDVATLERLLDKSEEMLEAERRSHHATRDRYFASKNQPPEDVDLAKRYEELQVEQKERKELERVNGGPIPSGPRRIGSVDRQTQAAREDVRRAQKERTEALQKEAAKKKAEAQAS